MARTNVTKKRRHRDGTLSWVFRPSLYFSAQVAAVVKPVGPVDVDNLDFIGFGIDAFYGVGMIADDVLDSEEG